MTTPNIFVSHRWADSDSYESLVKKFDEYGFEHLNYSVPSAEPLDAKRKNEIKIALKEQVRQCNYFLIFAKISMANSEWCQYEVEVAQEYKKPILSVKPYAYTGNVPVFIQNADTEGGPVGFNTPAIIRKICETLAYPVPTGV
jgi:hypothetical protein